MAPERIRPGKPLSHYLLEAENWHRSQGGKGPLTEERFKTWLEDYKSPKTRTQVLGQLQRGKGLFEKSVPRMKALRNVPARDLPDLWASAGSSLMGNMPPELVVHQISRRLVEEGLDATAARAAARHIVADAREQVPQKEGKKSHVLAEIIKRKRRL